MLTIKEMTITPEMAKQMLEKNIDNNRLVNHGNANYYAKMMEKGEWIHDNGEFIKYDVNGSMFDGQHRLWGIIKCGKPQKMYVVEGCNTKSFLSVDNGKKRNLNDIFKIVGFKDSSQLATMVTSYHNLANEKSTKIGIVDGKLTTESAIELVNKYYSYFEDAITNGIRIYKKTHHILKPSLACSFYLLFKQIDENRCKDFFEQFLTAILDKHPASVLRRKLHENSLRKVGRYTTTEIEQFIIIAWNSFMQGKEISIIKIKETKQSLIGLEKVFIK